MTAHGEREYMPDGSSPLDISLSLIVYADSTFKVSMANKIAADLTSIGIPVKVREMSWDNYQAALKGGKYDLYYGEVALPGGLRSLGAAQIRRHAQLRRASRPARMPMSSAPILAAPGTPAVPRPAAPCCRRSRTRHPSCPSALKSTACTCIAVPSAAFLPQSTTFSATSRIGRSARHETRVDRTRQALCHLCACRLLRHGHGLGGVYDRT